MASDLLSSSLHHFSTFPNSSALFSFTAVALALSLLVLLFSHKKNKNKSKSKSLTLPPSPPGWPVVGNLFQVAFSGKAFWQYVRDLHQIYGPIFSLRMGSQTIILINNAYIAHEALIEKSQIFASRPMESPTRTIFSSNKFTVNSSVYGPQWRSLRRNMVSGMLSTARIREFRAVRDSAMDRFVDRIRSEAESSSGAVWVLKNARFAVFVILLEMCFGLDLDEDTIVRVDMVMKKVLLALSPRVDDFLPILGPFFANKRKEYLQIREEQINTIVQLIERRRSMLRDPAKMGRNSSSFSYFDSLLDLQVEGRKSSPSDAELVSLCSELLNGGTDTTATIIEWAIAHLIDNPAIQFKLYDEIMLKVGRDRKVDEKDTEKMVYLQAFVKELLRKHPPTYFALTHAATETSTLAGYQIPADANIEFYLPGISEDPVLWRDPTKFDPDRFVTGGEDADLMGVGAIRMMPFGAGRRICPGMGMGMAHIALMVARMVREFEWAAHSSQPKVDFTEKQEFTVVMNTPLRAMVRQRK